MPQSPVGCALAHRPPSPASNTSIVVCQGTPYVVLFLTLFCSNLFSSDQIPGKPQSTPILLVNADLYPVASDPIKSGKLLFENGRITALGQSVDAPANATIIDCSGKRIYPGLFASGNDLGLAEIRSVAGSMDTRETGDINPNARAEVAVNPDSELIPVARANGVLLNLTIPAGTLLAGSSAVLQLDGWTWEDLTLRAPVAIHVTWPRMSTRAPAAGRGGRGGQGDEQTPRRETQLKALDQAFADARAYLAAKKSPTQPAHDARWESMIPLLEGKVPLVVAADEAAQIQAAVAFAVREEVKLILFGGYDAPLCAGLLKKHDVPVVVNGVQRLPLRPDAPYDEPFTLADRLRKLGLRYCITGAHRFGGSDVRNLPHHAATAAAHGLPVDEALKSITLYPAQIFGVADRVGALAPGKDATLIITTGDILETRTRVEQAFIRGRPVDLTSKHTQLYHKYRQKYEQQNGPRAAEAK